MTRHLPFLLFLLLCGCSAIAPKPVAVDSPPIPSINPKQIDSSLIVGESQPMAMESAPAVVQQPNVTQLTLTVDRPCVVQDSTNLVDWQDVTSLDTNTPLYFLPSDGVRCFRAVIRTCPVPLAWDFIGDTNVLGVALYCGSDSRHYSQRKDVGLCNFAVMTVNVAATNYLAATTYDAAGNESDFSPEVTWVCPRPRLTLATQ